MDDHEIISLFLERSEQAIESLSVKYGEICCHFAKNILDIAGDTDDCINDAYLAVWNTIPPERPNSLLSYLLGLLRNICFDRVKYRTAEKRDQRLEQCLDELMSCIPDTQNTDLLDSIVIRNSLNDFLGSLSKSDRYLFLRRYYHMDTCRQIAKESGMHESAVSTRLNRLKRQLKNRLLEEGIFV